MALHSGCSGAAVHGWNASGACTAVEGNLTSVERCTNLQLEHYMYHTIDGADLRQQLPAAGSSRLLPVAAGS